VIRFYALIFYKVIGSSDHPGNPGLFSLANEAELS
jgi:hypothetical protein